MSEIISKHLAFGILLTALPAVLFFLLRQPPDFLLLFVGRFFPAKMSMRLQLYLRWKANAKDRSSDNRRLSLLAWKWTAQLAGSVALTTFFFFLAALLTEEAQSWWPEIPYWSEGSATVVWMGALLAALPLFLAAVRKLKAAAILSAEVRVIEADNLDEVPVLRSVVAGMTMLAGIMALIAWALLVAWVIAPPWPAMLAMLLIVVGASRYAWRSYKQFYAKIGDERKNSEPGKRGV